MTSHPSHSSLDLVRPALWLAAGGFAAGFGGYLAFFHSALG